MTKADAQRYADEFIQCFAFGMTPSGSDEFLKELGLWPEEAPNVCPVSDSGNDDRNLPGRLIASGGQGRGVDLFDSAGQ